MDSSSAVMKKMDKFKVFKIYPALLLRSKHYSFLNFCREQSPKILETIANFTSNYPKAMDHVDYRMLKGDSFIYCLEDSFANNLYKESSKGYDMIYREDGSRLSIKTQKNIFSGMSKKGNYLGSKDIVLKNKLGDGNNDLEFDYLLAIQTKLVESESMFDSHKYFFEVGFAAATYNTVMKHIVYQGKRNDQIKANLNDNDWDFYSGIQTFVNPEYDPEKQIEIFEIGLDKLYKDLFSSNNAVKKTY